MVRLQKILSFCGGLWKHKAIFFIHISGTLRPCGPLSLDAHAITSENHGTATVRWCECTLAGFLWED
jgi:hypothetical protein